MSGVPPRGEKSMKPAAPWSRTAPVSSSAHWATEPPIQWPSRSRVAASGRSVMRPGKLKTVRISRGSRPMAAAASSMTGREARYRPLSQSAAWPGIQPSATRPVAARDFGPTDPVHTAGAATGAGSIWFTW
jgi:hypothetical protein